MSKDWIKFVCKDCGHINESKKINGMWDSVNPKCDKCGGKVEPDLVGTEEI